LILFWIFLIFVVSQRVLELIVAKKNKEWILSKGGYEVGASHYKYFVLLHSFFFISLTIEVIFFTGGVAEWWVIPLTIFVCTQGIRIWCLRSLGRFWNTRIMILPGANIVEKGPYRWLRHPNYVIVMVEFLVIPLLFKAYITMVLFSVLNMIILSIRISYEEKALIEATNYSEKFENKPRIIPQR